MAFILSIENFASQMHQGKFPWHWIMQCFQGVEPVVVDDWKVMLWWWSLALVSLDILKQGNHQWIVGGEKCLQGTLDLL